MEKKIGCVCIYEEKAVILCEEINNNINQQLFRAKQHIARQGNENFTMIINIRKATKEDVAYIAEGIYYAFLLEDKALYNQWIKILKEVCAQEDTHYSYRNTWIAEVDGERAGMMIAVDGEHYREQRDKMYPQLKGLFDVAFGKGWDDMEDEAKAMAREQGIGVVTLAVEPMNTAKKLYQKLGFAYQRMIKIFNEEYELYVAENYGKEIL